MTNYLEVTNLSKSFDSFQLHNISFTLPKGYIMGLIGPNGSGKTTTIKLILNIFFLRQPPYLKLWKSAYPLFSLPLEYLE